MLDRILSGEALSTAVANAFRAVLALWNGVRTALGLLHETLQRFPVAKLDAAVAQVARNDLARRTTPDSRTIMFDGNQGQYTCNPKYICEEILRRKLPYRVVWVVRATSDGPYPPELTFVKSGTADYYRAAAEAKVVVQNAHSLQKNRVPKQSGQTWIQTWHGSLGLKRLEGAAGDEKYYSQMRELQSSQTDLLISNSQFEDDVFASTYWPGVKIARVGHPRNDILFDTSPETQAHLRRRVLSRLQIEDHGQRFLLFAPTHGDGATYKAFGNLDFEGIRNALREKFSGEWEILVRVHNNNKAQAKAWLTGLPAYCHGASRYPDMQELMVVADVGVTDYSSWVSDLILARKPAFLFGLNLAEFNEKRGFYFDIETDTPFSMASSNAELVRNVEAFDKVDYERKVDEFLAMCECVDDGKSAARTVDLIEELMGGSAEGQPGRDSG